MSAITQRGKRKTAGRRMNALVGKAQEEDDAFWGHDTWADDDGDSGNESFNDSDADSALKKDEFDSDFDDSESDHEEEERAAGEQEERELKRQERSKGKSKGYMEVASKRSIKGRGKRVVGDGLNAGIVLNFPPSVGGAPLPTPAAAPLAPRAAAVAPKTPAKKPAKRITMASTRTKRSGTFKRLRESTTKASAQPPPPTRKTTKTGTSNNKKRTYTQEELLMEAVHKTEPENLRWLLARKRIKDIEDQDKEMMSLRDKNKGPVIQKYHSKRGCLKTLTFPIMDSVPEILTRKKVVLEKPKEIFCVITGKPARYKDPKTNLGYFDLAAFKELRRRLEAKEPLDQLKKPPPKAKPKPKPKPAEAGSTSKPKAKAEAKAKVAPKPATSGINPTDIAPSTPKPTGAVSGPNAVGGPNLLTMSPRRISPRARKPSEKMRENIVSNPQLSKLVKQNTPSKPSLVIPNGNTTSNPNLSGHALKKPAPKPSPPNITPPANPKTTTAAVSKTKPGDSMQTAKAKTVKAKTTTAAVSKTKPGDSMQTAKAKTVKAKTTTAAVSKTKPCDSKETAKATTTKAERSKDEKKPGERVYPVTNESTQGAKDHNYLTQSQLIMQVIQDYNKQHPEVQE